MSRKPLSARNTDFGRPPGPGGEAMKPKPKRERGNLRVLDRPSIISQLAVILSNAEDTLGPLKVVEEDLLKPTPERVQMIYFRLLNASFNISVECLAQAPFSQTSSLVLPELMEDFIYRIQFFRAMKFLMKTCLTDFKMADILTPDPKRFCRHLSAFINFMKFHYHVFAVDEEMCSQEDRKEQGEELHSQQLRRQKELQHQKAMLEKQRREEHDLEEEHKARIVTQTQEIQALQRQEESLLQQYQSESEAQKRSEQRLAELLLQLDKLTLRVDDLRKKVVTSPDKLKASLRRLQVQVSEAIAATREMETQQKMWEALTSQAHQVPEGVAKALGEKLDALTLKVTKRNELTVQHESIMENTNRQEHLLQEATSKLQTLHTHMKMLEEDSGRMALQEGTTMSHTLAMQELHRDFLLQQQEVRTKELEDEKLVKQTKEEEEKMLAYRRSVEQANAELEDVIKALLKAYHDKADQYRDFMKTSL